MQWSILAGKLPLGSFSLVKFPKASFSIFAPIAEFFSGAASFELQITKIGRAFLKLLDSTYKLEIPLPASERGDFGA
jgi:hypothetical protein